MVYNKSQGDNMSMLDEARKQINEIDAQMAGIMQWMLTLKRLALMIPGWIPGVNRISIQ